MIKNGKRPLALPVVLLVLTIIAFIFSSIRPLDRLAWMGQVVAAILLILLRAYFKKGRMLGFLVILSCLGFSAAYELSEFAMIKILTCTG